MDQWSAFFPSRRFLYNIGNRCVWNRNGREDARTEVIGYKRRAACVNIYCGPVFSAAGRERVLACGKKKSFFGYRLAIAFVQRVNETEIKTTISSFAHKYYRCSIVVFRAGPPSFAVGVILLLLFSGTDPIVKCVFDLPAFGSSAAVANSAGSRRLG